jgi:hypothetical protein
MTKFLTWFWAQLTRVGNNADFVNAGDDVRYDPFGVSSWIQRHLSFRSEREYVPGMFVGLFPPFVVINIPLRWSGHKYFLARAGWRYDRGARPQDYHGYIFEATIKILDHVTIY